MPRVKTKAPARRTVFLSYCHANHADARECVKWLRPMCLDPLDPSREPRIWVDYEAIKGGDEWERSILAAVEAADVFIVLMSIDYANSRFCMEEELRRMLLKRQSGQARVIGVALHNLELGDFKVVDGAKVLRLDEVQCLPQGEIVRGRESRLGLRPVNQWPDRNDAWYEVRRQVEAALAEAHAHAPSAQASPPAPATAPTVPVAAPAVAAPPPRPAVDTLRLPYLCNRDDQVFLLADRLDAWEKAGSRRPLLVLTEGRIDDCVQEWVERMHRLEIASALERVFAAHGISFGQERFFVWPPGTAGGPAGTAKRLGASFAKALGLPLMTPIAAVHAAQATPGLPALWWTECADDETGEAQLQVLDGLLSLLGGWPDLDPRSMLVVAVTLVRDVESPPGARARLGPAFEAMLGKADAAGRVACVALGSLPEIDSPAVTAWSHDPRIGPWLKPPPSALIAQLPGTQKRWPMRRFADLAAGWLHA